MRKGLVQGLPRIWPWLNSGSSHVAWCRSLRSLARWAEWQHFLIAMWKQGTQVGPQSACLSVSEQPFLTMSLGTLLKIVTSYLRIKSQSDSQRTGFIVDHAVHRSMVHAHPRTIHRLNITIQTLAARSAEFPAPEGTSLGSGHRTNV